MRLGRAPPSQGLPDGEVPVKVFCIGLHRTGTRSLHSYLSELGFRSVHWPHRLGGVCFEALCIPHLQDRGRVVDTLAPVIEHFDAFSDVPFPALYRELDARYAGSRFILVRRDLERWWDSLVRHWRLDRYCLRPLHPYEYLQYSNYTTTELRYATIADKELFLRLHAQHLEAVTDYFSGGDDRLVSVDLEDPGIAAKLSAFLGVSSEVPFPRVK